MKFRTLHPRSPSTPSRAVVLLPGWATDFRIFDSIFAGAIRVVPEGPVTADVSVDLASYLRSEGVSTASIFGWSLGGVAALLFARAYPEFVSEVVLAGVRPGYPSTEVDAARRAVEIDKAGYLADFYRRCFLPGQREDYRTFKGALLEEYVASFSVADLRAGLDFLQESTIDAVDLTLRPTTMLHGAVDVVASVSEIAQFAVACEFHVVDGASHAVFLTAAGRRIVERE